MATLAVIAARRAATLARTPAPSQAASLIPRRGLAGAADHHGPPKVNFWQDPMSPSKWKEEHFVIVSLSGWGLLIFSGYKFFTGGKGKKEEVISNELFLSSYRESSVLHDVISIMEWLSGMSIANIG
ncbi:hypothetical protein QQP08_009001 [Theobroma cacao]|nr:hypothetical protein QQP08_009001 [Theobroma cacao]